MGNPSPFVPDNTAVRVALWRALHAEDDPLPHVLDDRLGKQLVGADASFRGRPDMHLARTARSRASIVARARFVEDLVESRVRSEGGALQYVLLGAGLDTFAQRRADLASHVSVFEVERPETSAWKRARIVELGLPFPETLHLVPVDFETPGSWLDQLQNAGFDARKPSVVASLGVVMYLTEEAILTTLRKAASLAPGSSFVISYMKPIEQVEPDERPAIEGAERGARANGTPFLSFFTAEKLTERLLEAGFAEVEHVTPSALTERYFAGRTDGLRPSSAEALVVATVR